MKAIAEHHSVARMTLDGLALHILELLQADARCSRDAIGKQVGLSAAAVHERIRKLEQAGVIREYAALLDPEKVGCDLLAFVQVFIDHPRHEPSFLDAVGRMPEVQECHRVTGAATCLLKVRVRSRQALQTLILDRLNAMDGVRQTETILALSTTKETPRLHLAAGTEERP
jgi:Lrp/AsnC family leucine-responsive transcriptional regulator